ncbi:MAG: DUF3990 domain-containing protein [Planctomycetaceae bacterium]|jgi:hypothetical protein|nr:DUF3990 domain-containing protein [Planctomycetaceae bacterium]
MILYHGSNCSFDKIELSQCRPSRDFGHGFYTTEIKEQALQMAQRTTRMSGNGTPVVLQFIIDDNIFLGNVLKIRRFAEPDWEWATFVMNNRDKNFTDISSPLCNTDNKFDIVTGPVANDDLRVTLTLFIDGRLTADALAEQLRYKELTQQISFHTQRAIDLLQKTGECYE